MGVSRREFLGLTGGLTAACGATGCGRNQPFPGDLPYRVLGRTDLRVSLVGFGAQRVSDPAVVRYALDKGINHIETSLEYDCSLIGSAIRGRRDRVLLMVATRYFEQHLGQTPAGTQSFLRYLKKTFPGTVDKMLRRLHTDRIDVFLLKQISAPRFVQADWILESLSDWRQAGKVRYCGVTSHKNEASILRAVSDSDVFDVAVVPFNYASPAGIAAAMAQAARKGVGVVAMKTQSPNYVSNRIGDAPDHRHALAWVVGHEFVSAAIPGMKTRREVDMNLQTLRTLVDRA